MIENAITNSAIAGTSSSSSSNSSSSRKRRTKTGCRECRERRVKCIEGAVNQDGDRTQCVKCSQRRRACHYPDLTTVQGQLHGDEGNGDGTSLWKLAPVAQSRTLISRSQSTSQSQLLSSILYGNQYTSFDALFAPPHLQEPHRQSGGARSLSISGLSPASRISLFGGIEPDSPAHFLVTYLFQGKFSRIGAFGESDPSVDHFQTSTLPFLAYHFASTTLGIDDEDDLLYHSALRLSATTANRNQPQSHLEQYTAEHAKASQMALAKIKTNRRKKSEKYVVGLTLHNLAALSDNAPISNLVASDFQAELSSLLGHQVYDVMCIYAIQLALMNGTRPVVNVPLAGDVNLETTFGISREMWSATNTTAILLSHARTLYALPGGIGEDVLYHDACSAMEESEAALQSVLGSNSALRIQQGTRMQHLALSILILCEVSRTTPSEVIIQQHCHDILSTFQAIRPEQRLVGCDLPMTIAAAYCSNERVRGEILEAIRQVMLTSSPTEQTPAPMTIAEICWFLHGHGEPAASYMPWREAAKYANLSMIF